MEAEKAYRQSIAHQEKVVADSPSVPRYRNSLFQSHGNLGTFLRESGRPGEAENAYRQAVAHQEKALADSPSVPQYRDDLASGYGNLAEILTEMGRWAEAEQPVRRAILLWEKLTADSPSVPQYLSSLAWGRRDLGDLLAMTGRPAEAEPAYRQAIALFEKVDGASSVPDNQKDGLASSVARLASILEADGRGVEAEQEYGRAIALAKKLTNPDTQNDLSWAVATSPNRGLHEYQLALRLAKKAVEESPQDGAIPEHVGHRPIPHRGLEGCHRIAGEIDAAPRRRRRFRLVLPGHGPMAIGQKDKARQWYGRAVESMEKNKSQDDELRRFRAEAAALLGVTDHPTSSGKKEENAPRKPKP